jgi:hypothetical protein
MQQFNPPSHLWSESTQNTNAPDSRHSAILHFSIDLEEEAVVILFTTVGTSVEFRDEGFGADFPRHHLAWAGKIDHPVDMVVAGFWSGVTVWIAATRAEKLVQLPRQRPASSLAVIEAVLVGRSGDGPLTAVREAWFARPEFLVCHHVAGGVDVVGDFSVVVLMPSVESIEVQSTLVAAQCIGLWKGGGEDGQDDG